MSTRSSRRKVGDRRPRPEVRIRLVCCGNRLGQVAAGLSSGDPAEWIPSRHSALTEGDGFPQRYPEKLEMGCPTCGAEWRLSAARASRASLTTNVATGGYLIPLSMDPHVAALTSDGVANPIRQLATVKTTASSPYRAVTSAGVTASWVPENTAISDGSPTFVGADIPLHKLAALVSSSYELFADAGAALVENLVEIFADARDTAEGAAWILGSGSGAPTGIVTAISATSGVTVTATTRGAYTSASAVDTFALLNALPARARQSKSVATFANNTTITTARQQIAGTGGVALTDLSAAVPSILGVPWHEASSMTASTTSGSILAVAGDFSRYMIVDHVQGPSLEFVANLVDGSGVPTGTRGWVYWERVGGDCLDDLRFRLLKA